MLLIYIYNDLQSIVLLLVIGARHANKYAKIIEISHSFAMTQIVINKYRYT